MKSLNLAKTFKALNGQEIKLPDNLDQPFTHGFALANIILANKSKKFDAFKAFKLAERAFASKESEELDDADFQKIKEIVLSDESYSPLITGQLIEAFS